MAPFYGWGSTVSRLQPLRGDSLLFTIQFPLTCNVRNAVKYWIILYRKRSNNVVSPTFHQWWLLCDCYFLILNIVFIHRETSAFCFVLLLLFFFFLGGGWGGWGVEFWIYGFFNCNTSHFLYVASVKVTSCLRSILTVFSKQPNIQPNLHWK